MVITVGEASLSPLCFSRLHCKTSSRFRSCFARDGISINRRPNNIHSWNSGLLSTSSEAANFDPFGINPDLSSALNSSWENLVCLFSQTFQSSSSTEKDKLNSSRGVAAAIEDSSIDFGDFFKGPLPGKFLKLLGLLALSRLGVYIPLGGVNRDAFVGNLDQNSLLSTLDSFSGGGIGRLGICSLGIVPFINAQIVFQLLARVYPKLQDLLFLEFGGETCAAYSTLLLPLFRFNPASSFRSPILRISRCFKSLFVDKSRDEVANKIIRGG